MIARLYGTGPDDTHLATCVSCTRRWESMHSRYKSLRPAVPEVPDEYFAAQKRAIRARLGEKRHPYSRLLIPVVATLLLVATVILYRPTPAHQPSTNKISDSQLFEDVFSRVESPVPESVGPIRSLFEVKK